MIALRIYPHHSPHRSPQVEKAFAGEPFELMGTVERELLLKLIAFRVGWVDKAVPPGPLVSDVAHAISLQDSLEQVAVHITPRDQGMVLSRVSEAEREGFLVDLRLFLHRSPVVLQSSASYSRAYALLRTLGLRSLFVAPSRPSVQGIITRKDITAEVRSRTCDRGA